MLALTDITASGTCKCMKDFHVQMRALGYMYSLNAIIGQLHRQAIANGHVPYRRPQVHTVTHVQAVPLAERAVCTDDIITSAHGVSLRRVRTGELEFTHDGHGHRHGHE